MKGRVKGEAQNRQTSGRTLPLPIINQQDKDNFFFELASNIVPFPHRPMGRKALPVIANLNDMVPSALYWVRIWEGSGHDSWALCEYVEFGRGQMMKFKVLAAACAWEEDFPTGHVFMDRAALSLKQIRLAQKWTPLQYGDIVSRSVTFTSTDTGVIATVDLDIIEPKAEAKR